MSFTLFIIVIIIKMLSYLCSLINVNLLHLPVNWPPPSHFKQGGHCPGNQGKVREFEKNEECQGKVREFEKKIRKVKEKSGNFD